MRYVPYHSNLTQSQKLQLPFSGVIANKLERQGFKNLNNLSFPAPCKQINTTRVSFRMDSVCLVWLKRDLRLVDHSPLHYAVNSGKSVLLLWIYDDFMQHSGIHSDRHLRFQLESVYDLNLQLSPLISFYKFCYSVYRTIEIRFVP